jgi:predicted nucleotidyltransferase
MHSSVIEKREVLADLCRRFQVRRLEVFGSASRGADFDPARSDVDFLVEFAPDARRGLTELLDMQEAFAQVLGRDVDLIERGAIERSRNYLRRRLILGEAEAVYVT